MMRKLFAAFGILLGGTVNAQWDTLNTMVEWKFEAIDFYDANLGVAVGSDAAGNGVSMYTMNRGNTWTWFINNTSRPYHDVTFTPSGTIYVVTDSGRVVHLDAFPLNTTISATYLSERSLLCCSAINDSMFYCAGEGGVFFRTSDRGFSWDTISIGTTENINDIYFGNASDGWIVCDDGYMAVTGDSGNTWQFVAQPMWGFVDIMSFDYQDSLAMNPYLVGSGGVANFSVNAGVNWATIASGTGGTLQQIRFGTINAGLIVGDNGYILRTDNGGWTWFADPSSETVDLFDIAYAGDTTAFICGDSGVVLRSNVNISAVQDRAVTTFSVGAFPNPSNGPINLTMLLPMESDLTIDVIDITGNIIHSEYHENVMAGSNNMSLDLSLHAAGIYFVCVSNGFSAVNMKVIRQ